MRRGLSSLCPFLPPVVLLLPLRQKKRRSAAKARTIAIVPAKTAMFPFLLPSCFVDEFFLTTLRTGGKFISVVGVKGDSMISGETDGSSGAPKEGLGLGDE